MHLLQILLPLTDNNGCQHERALYTSTKEELTGIFGGITAYSRAPAEGRWKTSEQEMRDEIIIFEVMARSYEAGWWKDYRSQLEKRFRQEEIIIRVLPMELV